MRSEMLVPVDTWSGGQRANSIQQHPSPPGRLSCFCGSDYFPVWISSMCPDSFPSPRPLAYSQISRSAEALVSGCLISAPDLWHFPSSSSRSNRAWGCTTPGQNSRSFLVKGIPGRPSMGCGVNGALWTRASLHCYSYCTQKWKIW